MFLGFWFLFHCRLCEFVLGLIIDCLCLTCSDFAVLFWNCYVVGWFLILVVCGV